MAKAAGARDLPTDSTSLDELAATFHAKVKLALHLDDRVVPPDDRIPTSEVVAMFRKSAKNGRVPTESILSSFPALQTTWWAKRMIEVAQGDAARASEAEHALRCL